MPSGIYQLEFETGERYIGKSVDMQQRWKQHADKLQKGTAARPMQEAYHNSGYEFPRAAIVVECHPDLLDEYEGMYINLWRPELNTSIPERRIDFEYEQLQKYAEEDNAKNGVPALISTLYSVWEDKVKAEAESVRATGAYELLKSNWNDEILRAIRKEEAYDEIQQDARFRVERAKGEALLYKEQINRMERASWWNRLWKTW